MGHWRVRVTGSGDAGWANATFERGAIAPPTMLGPSGDLEQPDSPPLISWTSVPGAKLYNLQVSTDENFSDPNDITNYTPTRTTSAIDPVLVAPNDYFARVKADLGGGISTAYSEPISYTIVGLDAAERVSPAPSGVVTDAVLDWKPVPGAATYQVQIDDDSGFGSLAVNQLGITGTRFSPPKTVGNNSYYWRVRPVDAAGNARAWTDDDQATFQRAWPGQVHLQYPADQATVGNPFYYQWSPSERTSGSQEDLALSSSYTLEVATSPTFQGLVMRCNTVETTWVPQGSNTCWPSASGTYYWRVIGHDDWSGSRPATDQPSAEVRSFTYQPGVPTLIAPVGGEHVTIPTLTWSPVPGASRYRVTITPSDGGAFSVTTASTSYTPDAKLDPGAYSWQVQTVSQDNRLGTVFIFDQGAFHVDPLPAATGSNPDPLNSPSGRRFPTLKWAPVAGANHYELWVKPDANTAFTAIPLDFEYAAGESLDGAYLDPGGYDWFVKAFNNSGGLISAGTHGTFTINPLEVIPDDEHYAALAGTLLPDDPEDADADLDADLCRTQILTADGQSECDSLRNTPVLRWADKPNVGSYLLYVAHDKEMTNPVYDLNQDGFFTPIILSQPMWTPAAALPDSQADTAYYYRVVPCSYQKCEALSHAEHSFDKLSRKVVLNQVRHTPVGGTTPIACPLDSEPPNHPVCENDVTLSWQDFRTTEKSPDVGTPLQTPGRTEARSYVVQTAEDPSFSPQSLIESIEVDQTTFTSFNTTYPEGQVYWRVQAVDGSANKLDWSVTGVFDKVSPRPVLLAPDGSQNVRGDLFFSWTSLPFAAQYRIEVYKNHDIAANAVNLAFPAATVQSRMVSLTGLLPELPLMPNGDDPYVWRVRRIDAEGRAGAWSSQERLGPFQGRRVLGDADLSSRQRLGRAVRRAVHVVGRARRGELPLRTAARRHPDHRRAGHHACTVVGPAARDRRRELGVAGHPHRRVGQQPQTVQLAPVHRPGRRRGDGRRGDHWLRPGRHATHGHHSAFVELRRRGHHDLPVVPGHQPDRGRDGPDLHGDRCRPPQGPHGQGDRHTTRLHLGYLDEQHHRRRLWHGSGRSGRRDGQRHRQGGDEPDPHRTGLGQRLHDDDLPVAA